MKVAEFMSRAPLSVGPSASLDEAMDQMDGAGVRHVVVVEDGRTVGVVSERDLLQATGWLPKRMRELLEAPGGQIDEFMKSPVVTVSPADSMVTAALRMVDWSIGCLPVLDDMALVGLVSERDVMGAYVEACRGDLVTVESDPLGEQVMSSDFLSADPMLPAEEAHEVCRSKKIRHLPLMQDGKLVGIVSDRDFRRSIGCGQLEGTPVGELQGAELITSPPEARLSEAAELMLEHHISAIPIAKEQRMLGMISTTDVLTHCISAFAGCTAE